jgi:hypothetical protein
MKKVIFSILVLSSVAFTIGCSTTDIKAKDVTVHECTSKHGCGKKVYTGKDKVSCKKFHACAEPEVK